MAFTWVGIPVLVFLALLMALPTPSILGGPAPTGIAPAVIPSGPSAGALSWAALTGPGIPPGVQLGQPLSPTANVAGSLSFPSENPSGAAQVAAAITNPSSPEFQHYLTGDQFDQAFGPNAVQQQELAAYLGNDGIAISVVSPFLWNVRGTAIDMDAAFGTSFVHAVAPDGHDGIAPASAMRLPSVIAEGVEAIGAFQNALLPQPDLVMPPPGTPTAAHLPASGTLTLAVANPFYEPASARLLAPAGMSQTYVLTVQGGAPPFTVTWNWGDGTTQTFTTASRTLSVNHEYYQPTAAIPCDPTCTGITVTAHDLSGNTGSYVLQTFQGATPGQVQLFYNAVTLSKLGISGQDTKIGLDEMCDPGYSSSQYMADLNTFSSTFGLPLMNSNTFQLVGSGSTDSSCNSNGGGAPGWSIESALDMEWAHVFAPNATIVMDLSASVVDEGDIAWTSLSQGVFVDSNSWRCPYWSNASGCGYSWTTWEQAASQGQTYFTSSGDYGAAGLLGGSGPPATTSFGIAAGGTVIVPNPANTFGAEYAWNASNSTVKQGSTGGYASGGWGNASIPAPSYQIGEPGFNSTFRGIPDVSAIGGTYVEVQYGGTWVLVTGTSLSSPSLAAIFDTIYTYNGTAGRPNGQANYGVYAIAKGPNYNVGFHDITIGNNMNDGIGYMTTLDWDPVTGVGSPNIANLAMLMAEQSGNACAIGPLTSVLSASTTSGPAHLSVFFGADVTGGTSNLTGYTFAWNFGDGSTAQSVIPTVTHVYTSPGTYYASVTVGVTNVSGMLTTTNVIPIQVTGSGGNTTPLTAIVSAIGTRGGSPLTVAFSGGAVGGTAPYTYSWAFGDGTTSTTQSPSHPYATTGFFTATLTVTDAASATASANVAVRSVAGCAATPLEVATPTASRAMADVGQTVTFTTAGAIEGAGAPYSYSWGGIPLTGCTGIATQTMTCPSIPAGTWNVLVNATDSSRDRATSSTLLFKVDADPIAQVPVANVGTGSDVGQPVTFQESARGGSGGFTYAWNGLPAGCVSSNNSTLLCTPTTAGTSGVTASVTDSNGFTATSGALSFTVNGRPTATLTSTASNIDVGQSVTFTATATGGSGSINYAWSGLPRGCGTTDTSTLTCKPTISGNFTVGITVVDGVRGTGQQNISLTVYADPTVLSFVSTLSTVTAGNSTILSVQMSGGSPPYGYVYSSLPTGCSSSNTSTLTCTPTSAGGFNVEVKVTDANGYSTISHTELTVSEAPPPGGPGPGGGSGSSSSGSVSMEEVEIGAGVVVAVVIAAVGAVWMMRRSRQGTPTTEEPEAETDLYGETPADETPPP